ncbi:response regulator [Desulfovibrio inopinatus]|uniref:response regulator n=1 Tax=Desulfovibrio inopinatus TaxID=102109 RepID=UPI00041F5279|nr:response regulator [Desulfovibrio inopinatus]
MSIKKLRIGVRLFLGFGLMFLLTVSVGTLALYELFQLSQLTVDMYNHPFTVTKALRDIRTQVMIIDELVQPLRDKPDDFRWESFLHDLDQHDQIVQDLFRRVEARFLGDPDEIKALRGSIDIWVRHLRDNATSEMSFSGPLFKSIVSGSRIHMQEIESKIQPMILFADNKALSFLETAKQTKELYSWILVAVLILAAFVGVLISFVITRGIITPLSEVVSSMQQLAQGDISEELALDRGDELGELATSFKDIRESLKNKILLADKIAQGKYDIHSTMVSDNDALGQALDAMTTALRGYAEQRALENWLKTGRNELSARLVGEHTIEELAEIVIRFLANYLDAQIGALYVFEKDTRLHLVAGYAFDKRKHLANIFELGQGLVGQAAREKHIISITSIPEDYIRINSSFGDTQPRNIVVVPVLHENVVIAVIELGAFTEFSDEKLEFLQSVIDYIGISFQTIQNQEKLRYLLEQSHIQSQQLQSQQEELRAINEELEQQAHELRSSEEELQAQQEELQASNADLEKKNDFLEKQQAEIHLKNIELENIREGLEEKAHELELSTRYKSQFLANMSHELRTPLNSLLLLSHSLMDNERGNLDDDQVEFARVIYKSGNDLLTLINEILDLSKIESGKLSVHIEEFPIESISESLTSLFTPMTQEKGLEFSVTIDSTLPEHIQSDRQRVEQVLRNLLSNAVKFCTTGSVHVRFYRPDTDIDLTRSGLDPKSTLAIDVVDTGIGIPQKDQKVIFEAFQQVDGGTARQFGGTGLGLSISRELSKKLGGEIHLQSEEGKGSTFTLYLPFRCRDTETVCEPIPSPPIQDAVDNRPYRIDKGVESWTLEDDRNDLEATSRTILIIEDDPHFAQILLDMCHAKGFLGVVTPSGEEGLKLVPSVNPQGIILDIRLPGMDGLAVLDKLKQKTEFRHIPVHIISAMEVGRDALQRGAIGFLSKPASRAGLNKVFDQLTDIMEKEIKDLLLVEDDQDMRQAVTSLIGDPSIVIHDAATGAQALEALSTKKFDCMILDLGLPDMTGIELLDHLQNNHTENIPPVIVYTGRELDKDEELALHEYAQSIIIKGAKSEERLLDETSLFLHQMVSTMPSRKQALLSHLNDKDAVLKEKNILLVDDDMRNLFALAQILKEKGLSVIKAEDGQKAVDILQGESSVDLVLLDIMMPEMDGYETAKHIRSMPHRHQLPIIALTAKAMPEDRGKCLAAGANDYLQKPVDINRLLSMMRVWLSK